MPKARRSLKTWAIYVSLLGAILMSVPNALLDMFGIASTEEVWIRVLGMTVVVFGVLYIGMVRADVREMYVASVVGRGFAVVVLVVLGLTLGPWQLMLFAALDGAGAAWTWMALGADERLGAPAAA